MGSAPLPRGWKDHIKPSLLHAISLATAALTVARSRSAADGLRGKFERATNEIALLQEQQQIKDSRWSRLSWRISPHYTPIQRMRVLQLKAARGCMTSDSRLIAIMASRGEVRPTRRTSQS